MWSRNKSARKSQSCSIHFQIAVREGSCPKLEAPKLLCYCFAILKWCCFWGEAGQQPGQGCSNEWVPQTQQSKVIAWKSLSPMWCTSFAYPDLEFALSAGSWWVGRALKGPRHLWGTTGNSGWDKQVEQKSVLAKPPCGKPQITLWAGRSTGCFISISDSLKTLSILLNTVLL